MDTDKLDEELQGKVKQYNTEDLITWLFFMCNRSMQHSFQNIQRKKTSNKENSSMVEWQTKNTAEKS
jgi:hypothetical protein